MEGSSDSQVGNRSLHCTATVLVCISRTAFTIFIRFYFSDFCNKDVSFCVVGTPEAMEVMAAVCWPLLWDHCSFHRWYSQSRVWYFFTSLGKGNIRP